MQTHVFLVQVVSNISPSFLETLFSRLGVTETERFQVSQESPLLLADIAHDPFMDTSQLDCLCIAHCALPG